MCRLLEQYRDFEPSKTCRNTKFLKRFENRPDLPMCIPFADKAVDLLLVKVNDPKYKDPGQCFIIVICSRLHSSFSAQLN